MRQRIVALFVAVLLMVPAVIQAGMPNMRGPLFASTDAARAKADGVDALMLAPISYGEAVDYYKRAGNIDSIRRTLGKAQVRFEKSTRAAYRWDGRVLSAGSAGYSPRKAVVIGKRAARTAGNNPPITPSTSAHVKPSCNSSGVTAKSNATCENETLFSVDAV